MTAASHFTVREVGEADDPAALALESRCPQGRTFQIGFARDTFRRRTELFADALLLGAWQADRLVAVGGGAIKDVRWQGRETRALMLYDFRVDPEFRRAGVGRMLTEALFDWARPRAEIAIAFSMGDNHAIQKMAREWMRAETAPAFELLAYPARGRTGMGALQAVDPGEVRARHIAARKDASLLLHADEALASPQRTASWMAGREGAAACSVWSTAGILEEVVLRLPPALRAASWFLGGAAGRRLGLPHVPRLGERIRSCLLFDLSADDERSLRELVAGAACHARSMGIDHCHVVLPAHSPWRQALWRDVPRAFAPVLPFSIMARTIDGQPLRLQDPVIDPRDI